MEVTGGGGDNISSNISKCWFSPPPPTPHKQIVVSEKLILCLFALQFCSFALFVIYLWIHLGA